MAQGERRSIPGLHVSASAPNRPRQSVPKVSGSSRRNVEVNNLFLVAPCHRPQRCERHPVLEQSLGTPAAMEATRSARAIERVVGIDRIAIDTNIEAITAQLDLPLRRVVTRLAQRL
jgi:hypothetical protein